MPLAEHDSERAGEMREADFLAGGGEMGERIRLHHWATTPLARVSDWPQPLRMAVSLCVKSQLPIIIHWGWPDLIVLYNDAFIPLLGDKHPSALGMRLFEFWPELRPTIEGMLETVLTKGTGALSEGLLHVYNCRGFLEERYYTVSFNPIVLESGMPGGSFTLIDNITDRVIGERRLRTLRDLAARSGDVKETEEACRIAAGVLCENRYDLPFALLYVIEKDRKVARLVSSVGVDVGSNASPQIVELADPEADTAWPLTRAAGGNEPLRVDDLSQRFGPFSGGPWNDSPKSALILPITPTGRDLPEAILVAGISPRRALDDAYLMFLSSITTEIGAAMARAVAYLSRKGMEDQLRAIVHTIPALAWTANPDGETDFFNQRWLDFAGISIKDVLNWGWAKAIHPDDLNRLVEYWRSILASGETGEIEARIRRFDGEYRWFLFRADPLRDESGKIVKWYGTNVDIDDRKRTEQLQAELDRAKSTFFSNTSHEFRTPLTLLLAPLEDVLRRRSNSLELKDREALDLAYRNGLRLQKLVNSLLDFSRIEAGRLRAVQEATDIGTLTANLAAVFRSAIERAGMRLVVDSPPSSTAISVDRQMWEKIVLNLLSNALKYTFEGEIGITLRETGDCVELRVGDSGVGIPEQALPHIFERFYRVEGVEGRSAEGTGIGLALVEELVKLHDGTIKVESRVGEGSVFTVSIPRRLAARQSDQPESSSSVSSAGAFVEEALRWLSDPSSGTSVPEASASTQKRTSSVAGDGKPKPRILFVDDNADMRNYVSALLAERYELTTAADGLTALAKLRQQPADLVLSDIMMPGPDGFELLRAIRGDPATRTTPVILLTARAGEESTVEGLEQGADDYLTKPFNARELTARVAATLALARLRKESLEREQLSRSEAQLRQIVDAIPQMTAVLNPDGTLVYANHPSIEYTGLTIEELTRGDFRDRAVHPEDVARLRSERREALSRGERFENEQRVLSKNGQYRWFLMQYNPVIGEDGQVIRWYATATNIDDRKRSEERLRQENVALREEIDKASMFEEIVGTSPALQTVLSRVSKVAATDSTVLITGETGTGKELVARAMHRRSLRSSYPFVSVNCAAIPRDLIASELFGHEKGSFTGATQRRLGRFELAQRGTIFLDEVGELPAQTQIALLRVLQEHEFERVGGAGSIRTDVRVIAATNRDLEAAIAAGLFRSDLFYRLNVFPIEIPPLRERKEDIPLLVEYFIDRYARKAGKNFQTVNKESLDLLQSYSWPGNIRELQNVIERSVIVSSGDIFSIDESWLSKESSQPPSQVQVIRPLEGESRGEREIIEAALAESRGRIAGPSGAATKLQIPASTLEYKIKTLKISKNQFKFRARKLSK